MARARRQRGFSLLELLVTLFVIVLVTSMVTLNVGSGAGDYALRGQVQALADTANYALDEAQFVGWDYGLLLQQLDSPDASYRARWLERGPDQWRAPRSGKEVFADLQLPPGLELELELDGVIQDQALFSPSATVPAPQLVLYASGETAPGALRVRASDSGETLWQLRWDLLGHFRVLQNGLEPEDAL